MVERHHSLVARCRKDHIMHLITLEKSREDPTLVGNTYCNQCKRTMEIDEGYYTCCHPCDFDLCKACVASNTARKCAKDHSIIQFFEPVKRADGSDAKYRMCDHCSMVIDCRN